MQGAKGRTKRWAASAALVLALGHAGCATSHQLELDAGVVVPPLRDAGTTRPPDAHVDGGGGIASDAGTTRDQYVDLSGIIVDPAWDVDVEAWLDAGGCGEITVPYNPWGGQQTIVLVPGATMPQSIGGIFCQVSVDVAASPLIETHPRGRCSARPDGETGSCSLDWTSPLSESDYLWLCRIQSLPPVVDIWCWEWAE